MSYKIYAKIGSEKRYGIWDGKEYETRPSALKAMAKLKKIHGKSKKHKTWTMPGTQFKVVKVPTKKTKFSFSTPKKKRKSKGLLDNLGFNF